MVEQKGGSMTCSIEGCDSPAVARTYCNKHWKRWRTHGTPEPEGIESRMRGKPATEKLAAYSIPVTESGCWIWTGATNASGYGLLHFRGAPWLAHRVAWTVYQGEIPDDMHVLHKCDVRTCINPGHLFIGTNADNVIDKITKGRALGMPGDSNPNAKLTDEDVAVLRRTSNTPEEIAHMANMSVGHIKRLLRGEAR